MTVEGKKSQIWLKVFNLLKLKGTQNKSVRIGSIMGNSTTMVVLHSPVFTDFHFHLDRQPSIFLFCHHICLDLASMQPLGRTESSLFVCL